jgi:hypothetical protein
MVESPDARGADPISFGDGLDEAIARGLYRTDRVYIYEHDSDDASQHINIAIWARPDCYYYEVEPIGNLEDDHSTFADKSFHSCVAARVIRCIYQPP